MKTLLTISTLIFIVMFSSTSWGEWTKVLEDGAGNTYYLDFERVRKDEEYIYVWSLLDRNKPNHVGYFSAQTYRQIDCTLSRFQVLRFSFHEAAMGRGNSRTLITRKPVWVYPTSNSSNEFTLKSACSRPAEQN